MKEFIEKILIALLILVVGSFLIQEMSILKDNNTYQVEAKNYNGYLPLKLEDELINLGYTYDEYEQMNGQKLYGYKIDLDINGLNLNFYDVLIYTEVYDVLGYDRFYKVSQLYIDTFQDNVTLIYYNDIQNVVDLYLQNALAWGMYVIIVGYSNYEVE